MKRRKNFRKKPKDNAIGLSVTVFNNNVDGALKVLKRKVKDSNLFIDLRKKEHYEKPSTIRRQKKNMAKLRNKYAIEKEKNNKNY
jgi:small subunit ribosomal protein S21